jgi:hypothetical protein
MDEREYHRVIGTFNECSYSVIIDLQALCRASGEVVIGDRRRNGPAHILLAELTLITGYPLAIKVAKSLGK